MKINIYHGDGTASLADLILAAVVVGIVWDESVAAAAFLPDPVPPEVDVVPLSKIWEYETTY